MLVALVVLILVAIILLIQLIRYEKELRRMARFLSSRDEESNITLKAKLFSKGTKELVCAINEEFENRHAESREIKKQQGQLQMSLAHFSHDIRTPLTGARGYVQLLEKETDPQMQAHYYQAVLRRLNDLNHMLDQLFAFTQAYDPEYQPELKKIDAQEILSETLLSFYPEFQKRNIEPQVELQGENYLVYADAEALTRIIRNLVANALNHGAGTFSVIQCGDSFVFSNSIDSQEQIEQERLFERFYKADNTRNTQGSGLGLAIVAQLASAIGAQVSANIENQELSINLKLNPAN